jgi:hypothetical protein
LKRIVFSAVLLVLVLPILRARWAWEREGRAVTLCVDGAELDALFPGAAARAAALKELSSAGVRAVGVTWDGTEPPAALAARWPGFSVVWRPLFRKFSEGGRPLPWDRWGVVKEGYLLPAGPAAPPSADPASPLHRIVSETALLLPVPEFSRDPALRDLSAAFPERVIRAHSIDEEELLRTAPAAGRARFRRAVKERGIRFLYLHLFPGLSAADNLAYVAGLAADVRAGGFAPGDAAPRFASAPRGFPGPMGLHQFLAFLAVVLGPWLGFQVWKDRPWLLGIASLGSALFTAALLTSPNFLLGLVLFRGVKAAMVLPLILAAMDLYKKEDLKSALKRPLTSGGAMLLAAAAAAALVYVLRSGHDSGLGVSGSELRLRQFLENVFAIRPRFKEFAVGWPLLWLGAFLARTKKADPRPFQLAGLVAPISVVNTFCHAHIPLSISLLRVFHGFWLGALFGFVLIAAFRAFIPALSRLNGRG